AAAVPAPAALSQRRERALARGLSLMRDARLYRELGFVRLSDYVAERLGIPFREAEALMRREESLGRAPRIAPPCERGDPRAAACDRGDRGGAAPARDRAPRAVEVHAPAWLAASWRDSVAFVRQLVGSSIPEGACLGVVLAELATEIAPAAGPDESDPEPQA